MELGQNKLICEALTCIYFVKPFFELASSLVINPSVKKLILIFLLVVLPLQYSWAVVASYCQHEKELVTHLGHHTDEHKNNEDRDDSDKNKLSSLHECEYCHQACQASLTPAISSLMLLQGRSILASQPLLYSSYIPDGPERPERLLAA